MQSSVAFRFSSLCLIALVVHLVGGVVYFKDSFDGESPLSQWVMPSKPEKPQGKFNVTNKKYANDSGVFGLKTTEDARFYWISRRFEHVASTDDRDLIVQFSVAFEQDIDCGGGYIKLLSADTNQDSLTDTTPYYLMFGPDICGLQKRIVHVIISHNGTNHDCKTSPKCKDDVFTHVYTLHLRSSNRSYEVRIDNEPVQSGNISEDWSIQQPREIADPDDVKPSDWDDRRRIPDPKDTKPDGWDQPEFVTDTEARRPDDWDEEADGEWVAPTKANPAFRGEWRPRTMENPEYKGAWEARRIPNPDFVEDLSVGVFRDIGVVAIDVWQVKSGTVFSDFLITDDAQLAAEEAAALVERAKKERSVKEKVDDEEMDKMKKEESSPDEESELEHEGEGSSSEPASDQEDIGKEDQERVVEGDRQAHEEL